MSGVLQNAKQELGNFEQVSDDEVRLEELEDRFHQLKDEKSVIEDKLARYVSEIMELHERIDKQRYLRRVRRDGQLGCENQVLNESSASTDQSGRKLSTNW